MTDEAMFNLNLCNLKISDVSTTALIVRTHFEDMKRREII